MTTNTIPTLELVKHANCLMFVVRGPFDAINAELVALGFVPATDLSNRRELSVHSQDEMAKAQTALKTLRDAGKLVAHKR